MLVKLATGLEELSFWITYDYMAVAVGLFNQYVSIFPYSGSQPIL